MKVNKTVMQSFDGSEWFPVVDLESAERAARMFNMKKFWFKPNHVFTCLHVLINDKFRGMTMGYNQMACDTFEPHFFFIASLDRAMVHARKANLESFLFADTACCVTEYKLFDGKYREVQEHGKSTH